MKSLKSPVFSVARFLLFSICAICAICGPSFAQTLSVDSITFASTLNGQSAATQTATLNNSSAVTITSISVSVTTDPSEYSVSTSPSTNCGSSLTAGSTCTLTVTFTPAAPTIGYRNGVITVSWSGNASSPLYLYLSGYGQNMGSALGSTEIGDCQGGSSTGITGTSFVVLGCPLLIPAGQANYLGKRLHVHGSGVFTNAASSPLIEVQIDFCTVSGCGSGTVVAALTMISTADANTTSNAQFTFDGTLTLATLDSGSGGTFFAKGMECVNLGSATTAASSCFQDTATAAGSAIALTAAEYIEPAFKFSVSNASNAATLDEWGAEFVN